MNMIAFTPPDSKSVVEWALAYARSGMPVFPVGSHKRPVISKANGGAGYKDATVDEAQIRAWFEGQWRHADIGWAVPPHLVVADLDCKGGKRGLDDFARLEGVKPDDVMTPVAVTPSGGRHLVYAAKGNEYANEVEIPGTGIDLRTAGGYIVLPTADNGRQWLRPLTTPIAAAPAWLPPKGPRANGGARNSGLSGWTIAAEDLQNHARLAAIGMKLLVSGMNPGSAVNLLREMVGGVAGVDEERRQRRLAEIPAIISSAERKVCEGRAPEGEPPEFTFGDEAVADGDAKMEAKVAAWKAARMPDDQIEWFKNAALEFEKLPVEERRAHEAMSRVYVKARLANGGEHPKLTDELGQVYRENFLKLQVKALLEQVKRGALLLSSWLKLDIPPRDYVLGNVMCTTSRWLVYGETGVGKTLVGMDLAAAAASGSGFLNWPGSGIERKVMYLDGELPAETFKERMELIGERYGADIELYGYSRDVLGDDEMPPVNTPQGEKWLWREIDVVRPDVIMFDSIMCLLTGSMAEEESWAPVKAMVRKISRRRIAQVSYAGKSVTA